MKKDRNLKVPFVRELVKPTLEALILLGGSGNNQEINERVYEIMKLPNEILNIPHKNDGRTQIEYRLAWARTRAKLLGLIENSSRGIWNLVNPNLDLEKIELEKAQKALDRNRLKTTTKEDDDYDVDQLITNEEVGEWKGRLLEKLYSLSPNAFERLAQKILRESGFVQVEVTGKTGDGGIDGKGIVRINGFLSFHVLFQCKRYRKSVTPSQIRDFRGAMQGRTDKGIFITTGTVTREARKEANRDGAMPIDLLEGDTLCVKLKELGLGVKIELIEQIVIENDWFDKL